MVEILKELFRKLRSEYPRILKPNQNHDPKIHTVWKKNLFAPAYSRTVTNTKSLINCLRFGLKTCGDFFLKSPAKAKFLFQKKNI